LVWSFWPQPVLVELETIAAGPLQVTVDEDGKTRIKERYIVSSPVAGQLSRITLDPGDKVEAGSTLLATMMPNVPDLLDPRTQLQAEAKVHSAESALARAEPLVERAKNELSLAESQIERARKLAQTHAISSERLDELETQARSRAHDYRSALFMRDVAQFELDLAKAALWRPSPDDSAATQPAPLAIRSPINGEVLRVFQESARSLAGGTPLLEIGDPSNLEVEVDVLSNDGVRIRPGTPAYLEQWGGDFPLKAVVRLVEPAAFTKISALGVEEQRVNVILDINEPVERRRALGDAFRVEARIVIWKSDNVLQVPTGALFRHGDDWAVFVIDNGRARLRSVQIGQRNSLAAEIRGGLRKGDQVIMHPSDQVNDGVTVRQRRLAEK
jgi:HlyD family secretion protein